jgi:hypothetical protein
MTIRSGIALLQQGHGREIVKKLCRAKKLQIQILDELVEAELEQAGKERKRGLWERFDEIFGQHID